MPMIMPIIVPSSSRVGHITEAGLAALLSFGSITGLKVLVVLLLISVPAGAIYGWLQDREVSSAFMYSTIFLMVAAFSWAFVVASVQGLRWAFA